MMHGDEVWGPERGWGKMTKIHGMFCKKILKTRRCAANMVTEWQLGSDSTRGKALCVTGKYWLRLFHVDVQDIVRHFYER